MVNIGTAQSDVLSAADLSPVTSLHQSPSICLSLTPISLSSVSIILHLHLPPPVLPGRIPTLCAVLSPWNSADVNWGVRTGQDGGRRRGQ